MILALIFCVHYVVKTHVGPASGIAQHADLNVSAPFVFRFLLPLTLSILLPHDWLDLPSTRIAVATLFAFASIWLMPAFMGRVTGSGLNEKEASRVRLMMLVMLIAHYTLPRNLKFYYVYDFPAITFYQLTFMALTAASPRQRWLGVLLAAALTTNRETVGIAVIHAAAWHVARLPWQGTSTLRTWAPILCQLACAAVAVLLVRKLISHSLDHPIQASFSWMEGDQLRILANLERMATKHHHGIALLWFGAGAIIWLPRRWRALNSTLKHMLIASAPVFAFFCVVGNFVELRMFSELLPLLAAALAFKAPTSQTQTPGCA
ncbi:hypothetical protein [Aquabacterium parvum]|uniref:hypothetical protein n=1 Tax=Aquabacterium parvum TaxID=70584 RepID=UPI000718AC1B|nr:hypothetical protein [Aquabacterium parvum]